MGLVESLRAKYEIYRLEQKYTRRDKRKTFASGAQYIDGEYVHIESSTSSQTTSNKSWGNSIGGSSWPSKRGATVKVREMMSPSKSTRV